MCKASEREHSSYRKEGYGVTGMSEGRRSSRKKSTNDSRKAALERLRDATKRGVKLSYDLNASNEDPYELIDEEEYRSRKERESKNRFIVDGDYADEDSSDNEPPLEEVHREKKSKPANRNMKNPKWSLNNPLAKAFQKAKPVEMTYNPEEDPLYLELMAEYEAKRAAENAANVKPAECTQRVTTETFKPVIPVSSNENFAQSSSKRQLTARSVSSSPQKPPTAKLVKLEGISATPTAADCAQKVDVTLKDLGIDSFTLDMLGSDFDDSLQGSSNPGNAAGNGSVTNFASLTLEGESNAKLAEAKTTAASVRLGEKEVSLSANDQFVLPEMNTVDDDDAQADQDGCSAVLEDLTASAEDDAGVDFHCFDAFEDAARHPGRVIFFGKVFNRKSRTWISCSLSIPDVYRRLWLQPRVKNGEPVPMQQIYEEVRDIMDRMKVTEFAVKPVKKKFWLSGYTAENEWEYLELRYPFNFAALEPTLSGKTFSAVYGGTSSALELVILEQNVKGPSVLHLSEPVIARTKRTYCPLELETEASDVSANASASCAPLRIMVVNFVTVVNSKTRENEIVIAVVLTSEVDFSKEDAPAESWKHFCVISKGSDGMYPYDFKQYLTKQSVTTFVMVANERALVNYVLAKVHRLNPDVILGHDLVDFQLYNFFQRVLHYKMYNACRLSRLRRTLAPKLIHSKGAMRDVAAGRLLCDLKILAKEFIRAKDYSLQELAMQVLSEAHEDIPPEDVKLYFSDSEKLFYLVKKSVSDAYTCWRICKKLCVIPLTMEISRVVGGIWSKTLLGGRSERTEFLLLHAFNVLGYIYPDKRKPKNFKAANEYDDEEPADAYKKSSYVGGLVLEPKKGFYDKYVILLDFNSLYPSIIQEYNICFTTVNTSPKEGAADDDWLPELPSSTKATGVLPAEIKRIVESRRQVKAMLKRCSPAEYEQYNVRQQALKITANSVYGCLGFPASRFYARPLAALVTYKGREILLETKELVDKLGFEVVYGDTDSILINSNCSDLNEVTAMAKRIISEVNKRYRTLEIDIDGLYKKLLLLKKKKYAALALEHGPDGWVTKREVKGLDIVRRDWSGVAVQAGEYVVNQLLSDESADDVVDNILTFLSQLATKIRENKLPIDAYVIYKQLIKNPAQYADSKGQPHVAVALRMNSKGHHYQRGDVINYVICLDGTNNAPTQRAYHPSELQKMSVSIDANYYLSQQVLPVVGRVCEPIEGIDMARLASCLGLNSNAYQSHEKTYQDGYDRDDISCRLLCVDDAKRFRLHCPNAGCQCDIDLSSVFIERGSKLQASLACCGNAECTFVPAKHIAWIKNKLRLEIRGVISKYYENWLVCDDVCCGYKTRRVPIRLHSSGEPSCPKCSLGMLRRRYSDKSLYEQIYAYQSSFDMNKAYLQLPRDVRCDGQPLRRQYEDTYNSLKTVADHFSRLSAFGYVDLKEIFKFLTVHG